MRDACYRSEHVAGSLRSEVDVANLPQNRVLVRHEPAPGKNSAELILGKGGREGDLLSLIDKRRRVAGVHEVCSRLNSTFGRDTEPCDVFFSSYSCHLGNDKDDQPSNFSYSASGS